MNIGFEPATVDDAALIFALNQSLIEQYEDLGRVDYPRVLDWVRRNVAAHVGEYSRMLADGSIAGYFRFHPVGEKMEIDDLHVLPAYRSQGIGTAVIRKCIAETGSPVILYVFIRNTRAVALYERLGFQITQTVWDSRYLMERPGGAAIV